MTTTTQESPHRRPTIPATMKTAAIDRFGPPEALTPHVLPVPKTGPHEVLIAVHTAGVGIWDAKIRDGTWATGGERFPLVLGSDGAGVIVARGTRVRRLQVDDRVWAYEYSNPKGGFYAEYVAIKAEHVAAVPPSLDLLEAGAAAVTGLTAQQGIDNHLSVREGETVLIFGASGAVGTLAVQFAKRRRARVIGTASGSDATALVRDLGANEVFDPRRDDAADRLREIASEGLDAALAFAGGPALEKCLDLMNPGGRVAYPNGVEPEPKRTKGIRIVAYDAVAGRAEWAALERAVEEARLQVPISDVYPLDQAARAHACVERGHVLGRVVLRTRGGGLG
jgi:NADPH:quinone reductase